MGRREREKQKNMELVEQQFEKKTFIETSTGNRVSRKAGLYGSQNIVLSGKVFVEPECIIRGDLAHVRVGRFSLVKRGTVLRPSLKHFNKGVAFVPLSIGENCLIGERCVVSAAQLRHTALLYLWWGSGSSRWQGGRVASGAYG